MLERSNTAHKGELSPAGGSRSLHGRGSYTAEGAASQSVPLVNHLEAQSPRLRGCYNSGAFQLGQLSSSSRGSNLPTVSSQRYPIHGQSFTSHFPYCRLDEVQESRVDAASRMGKDTNRSYLNDHRLAPSVIALFQDSHVSAAKDTHS